MAINVVKGSFTPKNWQKWRFWGTAQGIHFRSTAIVQSVSGDARDVPFTTELPIFFGNDARFTGLAQAARGSI